jgi:YidC/Oxa1 family membrane protein insertase
LSQAKKVLRPEINEWGEIQKRRRNSRHIIKPGGINGRLRPRFITNARLLCFVSVFPSAIGLRQEGFLWAISSYDSIYELPFHIPFYGNHISLFRFWHRCNFFYMKQLVTNRWHNHSKECQIWQK